ncbi:MAG TPA: glycosyltransferase family 1 protein [Bryobacteraceae bacterium]|nr:glycosyltransferase family 1 protein [Bryobacteraceae bacterium]
MRIGVNALYLIPGGVGGTEIYLRNLLAASDATRHEWYVFTNQETGHSLAPAGMHTVLQDVAAVNRPARLIHEQTVLPLECMRRKIDVLLNPGFTAPVFPPCPNVTVFHDLQHKRHPEHFRRLDLPAWNAALFLSARRSKVLIAVSDATRDDLLRFYRLRPQQIHVVPHGVEPEFFEIGRNRGEVRPYVLCVSTLHPHKNVERLVRVFARWRSAHREWHLVLAGMRGFQTRKVEEAIASSEAADSIRMTGWIPREELYGLYRDAAAFVYPSTFEGFGLPVLEAMAARIPLACSDIQPLRSIVAGNAVLFDPHDDGSMLAALDRVTDAPVDSAQARAREFTWSRCASLTLEALSEAVRRE